MRQTFSKRVEIKTSKNKMEKNQQKITLSEVTKSNSKMVTICKNGGLSTHIHDSLFWFGAGASIRVAGLN